MRTLRIRSVAEKGGSAARAVGLRLFFLYGTVAGGWILFSDRALALLGLPLETERFISSVKGQIFVVVTAIALYALATRHLRKLYISEERHRRLFEHATEGLMLFRIIRNERGTITDLVIEDVNPTQAARLGRARQEITGTCVSNLSLGERMSEYCALVRSAAEEGGAKTRELQLGEGEVDELLSAYALEDDLYTLGSLDLTELRRAQQELRRQEERIREAYVDVLDAVTGGKLVLLTDEELDAQLGEPMLPSREIESPSELSAVRAEVRDALAGRFPELAGSMELLNPLGEALNNALKHAGRGRYAVFAKGGTVQVCVSDNGPGIDFRTLPKATLVAGFSTAATLGMGFTIMLQLCDRVLISTHPGSTTVVLELTSTQSAPRWKSNEATPTPFSSVNVTKLASGSD